METPSSAGAPTQRTSATVPFVVSLVAGLVICVAVAKLGGRREPWDSSLYFVAGIPIMCGVAFVLGYVYPAKPWRWAVGMAVGQSIALALGGGSLSLWPLALVAMAVLSLPQLAAAIVGSRVARRREAPAP
jgi:hypothetical protein